MNAFARFSMAVLIFSVIASSAVAKLEPLDPSAEAKQRAEADELFAKRDINGLLTLLEKSHLFIKTDVALKLGRLGADKALPLLRQYDASYSNFACSESGQFGVAVILIENKTGIAQKQALLKVATEPRSGGKHPDSVVDCAGRELSQFNGDDIITGLTSINTYGAQFAVLSLQCRKLSRPTAISKCITILEIDQTPQKNGAAQDLLTEFGSESKGAVEKLMAKMDARIKLNGANRDLMQTVHNQCNEILCQIQLTELKRDCHGLSQPETISKCIALLEAPKTPQISKAALRLLLTFGSSAKAPIHSLMARLQERLKTDASNSQTTATIEQCRTFFNLIRED